MEIRVVVNDKRASVTGSPVIVCNNSGYTVKFTFDSEWDGLPTKTARFVFVQNGDVRFFDAVFTGDTVDVPKLSDTTELRVGAFAGELRTTTPARIPCERSIRCGTGAPADPTPSQYDQIMELLSQGGGGAITPGIENKGKLLYVDDSGNVAYLQLGAGLEIINGRLCIIGTVTPDEPVEPDADYTYLLDSTRQYLKTADGLYIVCGKPAEPVEPDADYTYLLDSTRQYLKTADDLYVVCENI